MGEICLFVLYFVGNLWRGYWEGSSFFFSGFFVAKRGRAGCNFFYLRCRQIFVYIIFCGFLQVFLGRIMIVEFEASCFNFWLAALFCCQAELRTIKIWLRWRHSRAYYIFLRWGVCSWHDFDIVSHHFSTFSGH